MREIHLDMNTLLENERTLYKDSTYELISQIAYLIGVPKRIFENEYESPKLAVFQSMERDRNAKIIRNLCVIRAAIERNFKNIKEKMKTEYCSILMMPEYVPAESIQQLSEEKIQIVHRSNYHPNHYIIEINRLISDRINNCKGLFPLWINWQYIRELFIMPDGFTENGIKAAASQYYANRWMYPYQMYINWPPQDEGNILYNDKKFVTLLYRWHDDYFSDYSKVSDAGDYVKESVYDFIGESSKSVVVVDCENSDPYKLCATMRGLDDEYLQKIQKIILFDDVHTASAWEILEDYVQIPVEHLMIERVKRDKSLVDIRLTARACQEHYQNEVDSFIIVSSDSDYWGLISSLPDARFLVMLEREKCGPDIRGALVESGIFYCYIDDFYSGRTSDIMRSALFREMQEYLERSLHLNAQEMFEEALFATRIHMTTAERQQFYDKHIRQMKLVLDEEGNARIELKK